MGLTFNFNKKKTNKKKIITLHMEARTEVSEFIFFLLLNLLSSIHGVPTVGFRRVKHEKCSTQRGLCVGTKNTGFHREFR